MRKKQRTSCEYCINYEYDEDYECFTCSANLDEDELYRIMNDSSGGCPYYRPGDEYTIVHKQI